MLARLWSFLSGYVCLVFEGKNLEKVINMAVSRGLYLWDIKWLETGKVCVKVRLNGVKVLRHIARRTRSRFRVVGKSGLPFSAARLRKRKMLLVGLVLCAVLTYMMSSFIWFVEVRGNKKIPAATVIKTAEHAGLAMGTLKIGLDKDKIEKYIRNSIPETAWVGVRITGTKAVIEIAEKVIMPPVDNSPANVVAEKAGLVREILVLNGKAAVNEGDMVKQGDILITGMITPEPKPDQQPGKEEEEIEPPQPVRLVRARGMVRAKVWYEGYGESRLVDTGTRRTGRETEIISLRLLGKELVLKGPQSPPYADFVTGVDVKRLPVWRNIRIPVEIVTTNYYEVNRYRDIIGLSKAKSIAGSAALAVARGKVPGDAKIIGEITEEIPARGSNVIRIKVILEVMEDIGIAQPLNSDGP